MATSELKTSDKLLPEYRTDLLNGIELTGFEDAQTRRLMEMQHIMKRGRLTSIRPLLPLLLNIKGDPYTLERYFPFEPFFRTRMPRKTLLKTGRQVSKCGRPATTMVYDEFGMRRQLGSLQVGDVVASIDPTTYRRVFNQVVALHTAPAKPCFQLVTRTGVVLELADTHPLLKADGWTVVKDLKIGDRIATSQLGGRFGTAKNYSDARVRLTAYMLGDGCCGCSNNWSFHTSIGTRALQEFKADAAKLQALPLRERPRQPGGRGVSVHLSRDNQLVAWLRDDAMADKRAWEKSIPAWVFQLSKRQTALFISRLWATDGMLKADHSKPQISYCTTSRALAYELRSLLLKFGIVSSVKRRASAYTKDGKHTSCRDAWILRIETRVGWRRFMTAFDVPDKPGVALRDVVENNNRDTVPDEVRLLIADLAGECRGTDGPALHQVGLRRKPKYPPTYAKLRRYLSFFRKHKPDHPRLPELARLVEGDVVWDEIVSMESLGRQPCCDIEVEQTHNYLIDGIVSHNSTSLASRGVVHSNCVPFFSTLYITPLFEMVRRFSQNYVRPFIEQSPVRALFVGSKTTNSVLQRTFNNNSQMIFSFAFQSPDRTRGISADKNSYDEAQDLDASFIPVIRETMSGSKYKGIEEFAGTPKSLENTMEKLWRDSSQAEFMIKCHHAGCGHWNVPALAWDLEAMIGPYRDDITFEEPGVVCAKCRKPVRPHTGRWVHAFPAKRWQFAGYHVPQIIMPMHYGDREKWAVLLAKQAGRGNTPQHVFFNEVCGESYDSGSRIITETDLRAAAILPWRNVIEEAVQHLDDYICRVLAVDWGGGGEKELSFTSMAVLGMRPSGHIDVIWGKRSLTPHDHTREAELCIDAIKMFRCQWLAHDYTGAGSLRETFVNQAGYPRDLIINCSYVRAASTAKIMTFKPATRNNPRSYYQVDKARSLLLTCNQIKTRWLRFFQWDYEDSENPGLIYDFLALVDEKVDSRIGKDIYTVIRDPTMRDDFAQAVNIGCCALWNYTGKWPDVSAVAGLRLDDATMAAIEPPDLDIQLGHLL